MAPSLLDGERPIHLRTPRTRQRRSGDRERLEAVLPQHGVERRERRAVDRPPARHRGQELRAARDVGALHRLGGRLVAILERGQLANQVAVHPHERRRRGRPTAAPPPPPPPPPTPPPPPRPPPPPPGERQPHPRPPPPRPPGRARA